MPDRHVPAAGRPVPVSTYRVQLRPPAADHPGFGFADAAEVVPYLADLGVTHLYCSPYLQAAPGSAHGYDVVDHSRLNDELGGERAFQTMVAACREHGLGIVLDVVPNHMAVSEPESQNAQWWSLLREGRDSPYADWFDVDWESADNPGQVLVPVLGAPLGEVLDELELLEDRIRYYDHEVPIAPGTRVEDDLLATLERQHYRLCSWRVAGEELDYRRFFDVTTLTGVRVEVPAVFDETHRIPVEQVRSGVLDGLRIDHPDGLADPGGYLDRLAEATGGSWVVVEKILEPGEQLPDDWATAGTTGYDVLNDVLGVFVDPAGEQPLTALWASMTGSDASYDKVVAGTKRLVLSEVLSAEVNRLTELGLRVCRQDPVLRDTTRRALRESLVEVLASFGVYRAYLPPAGPADEQARAHVEHAVAAARASLPRRAGTIEVVGRLALAQGPGGPAAEEFVTRFQQTCGPVMAKGVEDTAFYRYLRLSALNEVGGDPGRFGLPVAAFHEANALRQSAWPTAMTTLSTHDTKRSEDVRARLVLLAQCPREWADAVTTWQALAHDHRSPAGPDPVTEQLVWQTLVGAWPLSADRAVAYVEKATREAKARTSWTDPVPEFDEAVAGFVRGVLGDERLRSRIAAFVATLARSWRTTALAQKAVQLTVPGVADTYQGSELWDLSLVDPDNRRPVDYDARRRMLALDGVPEVDDSGAAKLHVVSRLLRLRRDRSELFLAGSSYTPLDAGGRAVGFVRGGQVVTVAPTRALLVERHGWGDDAVELPAGRWTDVLTGAERDGGSVRLADLLADFPVAVLLRA
ncbi:MAG: GH13_26 / GH13 / GH13_20 / GH13_36 [uncultured Frankineae bacterium]|uniref:GH13_26 / GH13 / GH13_20 / GH13_36 n=1 Tax=uncultured Frankineae bacterium TaxID=437475 RepID=A0A6J4MDU8_9ACTN|nr:MAG: GH13_26 / GH13 / GH13_20 / GH13_36 [uncultured Frankineae bacterium]